MIDCKEGKSTNLDVVEAIVKWSDTEIARSRVLNRTVRVDVEVMMMEKLCGVTKTLN